MKNFFKLIPLLLLAPVTSMAINCSIVHVLAQEDAGRTTKYGNGFAVTGQHILVNDHTLSSDSKVVDVYLNGTNNPPVVGRVVHRDFHTDLAVIQVDHALQPCAVSSVPQSAEAGLAQIIGAQKGDDKNQTWTAQIVNAVSGKATIPGVEQAIEMTLQGNIDFAPGRSGSVIVKDGAVIGLLSQKTPESTLLAIPAALLQEQIHQITTGHFIERKYSVDYATSSIRFGGLLIPHRSSEGQGGNPHEIGGNPHEMGGNPHEKTNQDLSLDDRDLGYAVTKLEDLAMLRQIEPQIAEVMEETQTKTIYIAQIDNWPVHNELQLLRALGKCQDCRITSYWLPIASSSAIADIQNHEIRVIALATQLVAQLDASSLPPTTVTSTIEAVRVFHEAISLTIQHTHQGLRDPQDQVRVREQWNHIEDILSHVFYSEAMMDTVDQLRREIPNLF